MLDSIIDLDKQMLLFFNGSDSSYVDHIMWIFTGKYVWIPLVLSILYVFYSKGWKEALFVLVAVALVATLCDQISSSVFKPYFERFRPTHDPEIGSLVKLVNEYRGGRFGFISSHAANSAGVAMFLALLFRNKWCTFSVFLWALLSCYTRLYLGVHYPTDLLAGFTLGLIVGILIYKLYMRLRVPLYKKQYLLSENNPYEQADVIPILGVMYATFALVLLYALF